MLITPYFHPTTIVFADDNTSFLESISLSLPAHLTFKAFSRAAPAEAYLNSLTELPDLPSRCIRQTLNAQAQPVLTFDLDEVEREISNPARFERVSVVVIDFSMPDRDGIEMARALKHLPVKKLLLTGVADEKVAVAAFNEGIIDRFVRKNEGESLGDSTPEIEALTVSYFEQYVDRLVAGVNAMSPGFLNSEPVAARVNALLQDKGAVEHYLVNDPPGLLMLDMNGRPTRIAIASRSAREQQLAYAKQHSAPKTLQKQLREGRALGFFAEPVESYFGERYPWRDNIVAAEPIADGDWSIAVIDDAPADVDFDRERCCYGTYLRKHRKPAG